MSVAPAEVERPETFEEVVPDTPWVTIVWNDPVNLMSYVTYVFQQVFGYSKRKAEKLMLDVHQKGRGRGLVRHPGSPWSGTWKCCTGMGCGPP